MVIRYGDVVWVDLPPPAGSGPGGRRPAVVLQQDRFNQSRIQTIVVAAVTSNLRLAHAPGNVRLRKGEAGLAKPSVVNVSQLMAIDRHLIQDGIGRLSDRRLAEVWQGVRLVLEPPAGIAELCGPPA